MEHWTRLWIRHPDLLNLNDIWFWPGHITPTPLTMKLFNKASWFGNAQLRPGWGKHRGYPYINHSPTPQPTPPTTITNLAQLQNPPTLNQSHGTPNSIKNASPTLGKVPSQPYPNGHNQAGTIQLTNTSTESMAQMPLYKMHTHKQLIHMMMLSHSNTN